MDGREADNELKRRVSKAPVMKRGSRRARENQDENNKSAERTDRQPTTNTDHSRTTHLKGDKTAKKRGWMRVRGWVDGRGERVLLAVLVIDV